MSRPSRQPEPSWRPSRTPGLSARPAALRHLGGALNEADDVGTHQRRRDDAEGRERGVAAADGRLTVEDAAEAAFLGERLEGGAGVGDRDERLRAAARQAPEVVEMAARLERRPRLGGDDEERAAEVERAGEPLDRRRVRGVENVEAVGAGGLPQHLGSEARPAHPQEHGGVERAAHVLGEGLDLGQQLQHALRLVEPAEPAVLVRPRPERRVPRPDPLDELGRVHVLRGDELAGLGADAVEELGERVRELVDPLTLERGGDVVVVDPGLLEPPETSFASSMPWASVSSTFPWSWKASIVSSGIVLTVCEPISSSTYRTSR